MGQGRIEWKLILESVESRLEEYRREVSESTYGYYSTGANVSGPSAPRGVINIDFIDLISRAQPRIRNRIVCRRAELLRRQIAQLYVEITPTVSRLREELEEAVLSFQPEIEGRRVTRSEQQALLNSSDPDIRRAAWRADFALAHRTESGLRRLVRSRNEAAARLGYASYLELALEAFEVNGTWLAGVIRTFRRQTELAFRAELRRAMRNRKLNALSRWDLRYLAKPNEQDPLHWCQPGDSHRTIGRLCDLIGLKFRQLPVVLRETPNLPVPALCVVVDPRDIRVLVRPGQGIGHCRAILHELGHAASEIWNNCPYPSLRRQSPPMDEGVAEAVAFMLDDAMGLEPLGVPAPEARRVASARAFELLINLRRFCALLEVECSLYQEPEGPLDTLLAAAESRLLGVEADTSPRFAARLLPYIKPLETAAYVLGDCIAAQVFPRRGFETQLTDRLATLCQDGAAHPWQRKLAAATGRRLDGTALAQLLVFRMDRGGFLRRR